MITSPLFSVHLNLRLIPSPIISSLLVLIPKVDQSYKGREVLLDAAGWMCLTLVQYSTVYELLIGF